MPEMLSVRLGHRQFRHLIYLFKVSMDWAYQTDKLTLNYRLYHSVPAMLGKGQGAKEIGHNLARERPKFGHNLVRKRHKIFYV